MIYSSPSNYWIQPGALTFTLNALGDADKVSVAVTAGAVIMAYAKIGGTPIIDYNAAHNYRSWTIQASPTQLDRHDKVYVYARLEKNGTDALIIYPYQKLDIYGRVDSSLSSSSSSDDGEIDPDYFYIMLGALTSSGSGTTPRTWADGEAMSYGTLDTDQQRNEQRSDDLARMFQRDVNDVIWTQHDLTFVAGAKLLLLRMATLTGNATVDVTTITRSSDFSALDYGAADTSIMTSAAVAKYVGLYGASLESKFIRKDQADSTPYKLTMGEAEVTGDASVGGDFSAGGNATVLGNTAIGGDASVGGELEVADDVTIGGDIQSDNYRQGTMDGRGWQIDHNGNAELESATIRSSLTVQTLIVNRQQAQEGDTIFSDNDQFEDVESLGNGQYKITVKEKWDGYYTAQLTGNIIKGIINTLAAKEAGVSDYSDSQYLPYQETDNGGNLFYTSWMRVIERWGDSGSTLQTNQFKVVMYGDNDVPAKKNFPPCKLMVGARWGCALDPNEAGISSAEKSSRIRRQTLFLISVTDGRITKYSGVNKPILEDWMCGMSAGETPTFVKNWQSIAPKIQDGYDYFYAQGIIVSDFIKVDSQHRPLVTYVDRNEWQDNTEYLCNEYNPDNLQWETHDVWHNGCKWRCLQHQPVVSGGVSTYYEPKWNSPYWQMIEGSDRLTMEFLSTNGYSFRMGYVSTTVTPYVFYGDIDISEEVGGQGDEYWSWTRCSMANWHEGEPTYTSQDLEWNARHQHTRSLSLTNADMPIDWSISNKAVFTCTANVNDGKEVQIVQNQLIS